MPPSKVCSAVLAFPSDLVDLLRFVRTYDCEPLKTAYAHHLSEVWTNVLADFALADRAGAEHFAVAVTSLTPDVRMKYLSAPHVAAAIVRSKLIARSSNRSFLLRTVALRLGHRFGEPFDERWLPVDQSAMTVLGVPVASCGRFDLPMLNENDQGHRPLDQAGWEKTKARLFSAAAFVGDSKPNIRSLIEAGIEVIGVCARNGDETHFSSGTFGDLPGFTVLWNPHVASASTEAIVNAIVHEAVHGVLYRFEVLGRATIMSDVGTLSIASPWTERMLPAKIFVHACFVWFGLYNFWGLSLNEGRLTADPWFESARSGFLDRQYSGALRQVKPLVDADVYSALLNLQGDVSSTHYGRGNGSN